MCSFTACSRVSSAEHRGHESHAEPGESPRNPGHHERAVKGDDEGQQQHPENKDAIFIELNLNKFTPSSGYQKIYLTTLIIFLFQAGIIEEMLEDTFESMEDQDDMEEAAEAEVDKILYEITAGNFIVFPVLR